MVPSSRNLDEIWSWSEDRLHGALEGVPIGGATALEQLIIPALAHQEPAYNTVAAYLLVNDASPAAQNALMRALREASQQKLSALIRGIEVAQLTGRFAPIASMLAKQDIEHCAALCRLKAFQRAALGQELRELYGSDDPVLQVIAMSAAAHLPAQYTKSWVEAGLQSEHVAVRQAAAQTGIRARIPQAWSAALAMIQSAPAECATLWPAVAMFGGAPEHAVIMSAIKLPNCGKAAVSALAHVGTPEIVEVILELLADEVLSRVAGETYCAIVGVEIERDHLMLSDSPDGEAPSFEADDLNANLVPSEDELWPLPNASACKAHWESVRANFEPGKRYVRGAPVSLGRLVTMVETGPMLRRAEHIYELAARSEGQYDVVARAFTAVQRRMMSASRSQSQL